MSDITLLLAVPGTDLGIKAVMVEKGTGVPELNVTSVPEFVNLSRRKQPPVRDMVAFSWRSLTSCSA